MGFCLEVFEIDMIYQVFEYLQRIQVSQGSD